MKDIDLSNLRALSMSEMLDEAMDRIGKVLDVLGPTHQVKVDAAIVLAVLMQMEERVNGLALAPSPALKKQ